MTAHAEADSLVGVLSLRPLFVGMSEEQIGAIVGVGVVRVFEPDQIIVRQGQPGEALHTILSGRVSVRSVGEGGEPDRELAVLCGGETLDSQYQGDLFGEMSVLDFEPMSANVVALDRCEILIMPIEALFGVFEKDREAHVMLVSNLARTLSRRLRRANEQNPSVRNERG